MATEELSRGEDWSVERVLEGLASLTPLQYEAIERNLTELGTRRPPSFDAVLDALTEALGTAPHEMHVPSLIRLIAQPGDSAELGSLGVGSQVVERFERLRSLFHHQATIWLGMGTFGERNWRYVTILPVLIGRDLDRPFFRVEIARLDEKLLDIETMPSGLLTLSTTFVRELSRAPAGHLRELSPGRISALRDELDSLAEAIDAARSPDPKEGEEPHEVASESANAPSQESTEPLE